MFPALRGHLHTAHEPVDVTHTRLHVLTEDLTHVLVVVGPLRREGVRVGEFVAGVRIVANLVVLNLGPDLRPEKLCLRVVCV